MVAACTVAAAHRRDHQHDHFAHRAVAVCHDCHADSGFLDDRDAEALAERHIEQTRGHASPPLVAVA